MTPYDLAGWALAVGLSVGLLLSFAFLLVALVTLVAGIFLDGRAVQSGRARGVPPV